MTITPQIIKLYTEFMCEPRKLGVDLLPLKEVFIKSDKITPNHILYKEYLDYIGNRTLPKVLFYIGMSRVFGNTLVDPLNNNAGYYLKFNDKL